jgi:hypothetical protein
VCTLEKVCIIMNNTSCVTHTILCIFVLPPLFISKGFLGAAAASAGIAVTSSISGSGLPSPNLPVPKIEMRASAPAAKTESAPKSKIAFTSAPKGKIFMLYYLFAMQCS